VIAAEEPIVRYGVWPLLEIEPGASVVGEASDRPRTLQLMQSLRPEILILDLGTGGEG
jgi:DNA-binding NarL/FixJ family response regulator